LRPKFVEKLFTKLQVYRPRPTNDVDYMPKNFSAKAVNFNAVFV